MTMIYCSWIESDVDDSLIMGGCHVNIVKGRCTLCSRSMQLDYGVAPLEVMRRAKEE